VKLIIVSGLSGAGKSVALHTLEDLDYYCIDNLPVSLLPAYAARMHDDDDEIHRHSAVAIDARGRADELAQFPRILHELKQGGIDCEIIFLQADDETLLKRFSETRRKHPLSNDEVSLAEALRLERELLGPIAANADLIIDTTHSNVHRLRDMLRERIGADDNPGLSLMFESFGFKHGVPADADFVFDARCLPNPYWEPHLRPLTGRDEEVAGFLAGQPLVAELAQTLEGFLETWIPRFEADNRSYMTVAIGCTGGQHRSVYLVERLATHFQARRDNVLIHHRELT